MWWHLLLAVAVVGSAGFATKHFFNNRNIVEKINLHDPDAYGSRSRPNRPKKGVRVLNRSKRRRLLFSLKKRKITNNTAAKASFCSNKDNSLFDWGLSFGILFMMSAGKAEINKLNRTMDETTKLVMELKSELNRRKSFCAHQVLDTVGKMSGRHAVMLKKTNSELGDIDVKSWSPAINDSGECGSSALTEEPEPPVLEMDQLEAELEFELQKLSGCTNTIDSPYHEEIKPKLDKLEAPYEGYHVTDNQNFTYSPSHGVSASELNQKLSHLLIKQHENQIMELEFELHQVQSNLHEKETELHALKECVTGLTELSLSTVADDETQTSYCGNKNMDSESKQTVVGAKRPIDSESCSCYM